MCTYNYCIDLSGTVSYIKLFWQLPEKLQETLTVINRGGTVWHSGDALVSINDVILRCAQLVLRW